MTLLMAFSVIFLFFVIAAVLYGEVPKYFLLFQFDKTYHVFGLPFNPICESPRLWIITHLSIAIPHVFCTFYIIYDKVRGRATSPSLLTYFFYSHWIISASIAINMWHLGTLPHWKAFFIFTITLASFETFYYFRDKFFAAHMLYYATLGIPISMGAVFKFCYYFFGWELFKGSMDP